MSAGKLSLHPFLSNEILIHPQEKYTAIIGANPSSGARSPLLWNAAFNAYGINVKMYPFDVTAENLENLLEYLEETPSFLGGAVAVPYKENIASWLGSSLAKEAAKIGAVNCLARDDYGKLMGYNTDGDAAIYSFEKSFGQLEGRSVVILGCGGAAKSVSTFFKYRSGTDGKISIASRSEIGKKFADKLNEKWVPWHDLSSILPETDIVINCTPVGHNAGNQADLSPLSDEQLSLLPRHAIVYDIIYQPNPNKLFQSVKAQNLCFLDGSEMNLQQAVISFSLTIKGTNENDTRKAMDAILNPKF
jgi:shikimate dehydrogenase